MEAYGLNPCSNGILSDGHEGIKVNLYGSVLILVLMEYSLTLQNSFLSNRLLVLILVLMEYSLTSNQMQ